MSLVLPVSILVRDGRYLLTNEPPPTLADLVDADCDDGALPVLRSAGGQSDAGQRGDCFGEGREGIAVHLGA